jgi:hypothetical protein
MNTSQIYKESGSGKSLILSSLKIQNLDTKIIRLPFQTLNKFSSIKSENVNSVYTSAFKHQNGEETTFTFNNTFQILSGYTQKLISYTISIASSNSLSIVGSLSSTTTLNIILTEFVPIFIPTTITYDCLSPSSYDYIYTLSIVTDVADVLISNVDSSINTNNCFSGGIRGEN